METNIEIKVLGPGCANCVNLVTNTQEALKKMNAEITVTKVTDYSEINSYNVMRTPALVVNNEVLSSGKVLNTSEIINKLEQYVK